MRTEGTNPSTIDTCLTVADEMDIQVAIHTDTLNEAGFVEDSVGAIKVGPFIPFIRRVQAEGTLLTSLKYAEEANVLPSSANPTRPFSL